MEGQKFSSSSTNKSDCQHVIEKKIMKITPYTLYPSNTKFSFYYTYTLIENCKLPDLAYLALYKSEAISTIIIP